MNAVVEIILEDRRSKFVLLYSLFGHISIGNSTANVPCHVNSIAFPAQATAIFAFAHLQQIADPIVFLAAEFLFS